MKRIIITRLLIGCIFLHAAGLLTAQTLTLYAIPPPHAINWKTPHHLVLSMCRNFLSKKFYGFNPRPLGHVAVELVRGNDTLLTGMVADHKKDFFRAVFREKDGMGILFKIIDGHLEEKEVLGPEIRKRMETGRLAFLRLHINDSSYYYLKNYIDSFRLRGYDQLYNGLNVPRHGDGAGCSAFGVSFLELIQALDPEFTRLWQRDVPIPERLIGGAVSGYPVGIGQVFFSMGWARDNTRHRHLKLYDPELMYRWITDRYNELPQAGKGHYKPASLGKAIGLELDFRQVCRPQFPMFSRIL